MSETHVMLRSYYIELDESRDWLLRLRFWWRIVSTMNGQVIATSETYVRRIDRDQTASRVAESAHWIVRERGQEQPPLAE